MAQPKEDFWSQYSKMCLQDKIYPSKSIIKNLKSTELCCIVEAPRSEHWKYLLLSLCRDNSLTKVHFASYVSPNEDEDDELVQTKMSKRAKYLPTPYGRTPKNISNIMIALENLLQNSQILSALKLENLSISTEDAEQLANGLSKSSSLKYFSLSGCQLDEGAFPIICKSLNVSSVSRLDLSFCALNSPDIEALANVIKSHCIRRRNDIFQETLRNQVPYFQDMPGLTRISLNYNSLDDKMLQTLIEGLDNDIWVKALDLQNCDINNDGAAALLNLVRVNTSILVLDLRMNEEIDESLLSAIKEQLERNRAGKDIKCSVLSLWKPSELVRKYNNIGKLKTLKKPSAHKFKVSKKVTKSCLNVKKKSQLEEFLDNIGPEHQVHEISYTYLMAPNNQILPVTEAVKVGLCDASSQTPVDPHDINEILAMVKNLRHRLQSEIKIRKFLMAKYRQISIENAEMRQLLKSQNDDIYIDQETYFDVKHTFEKLRVFFEVMKKYGLWEYISMLGFDESTDVVLEENNSQKCMKVSRDDVYPSSLSYDIQTCCNCRKVAFRHKKFVPSDDGHLCMSEAQQQELCGSCRPLHSKVPVKDDRRNEKNAYKVPQESVQHVLNSRPVSETVPDICLPHDAKLSALSGNKQAGSASSNTTAGSAGAQMLIKKFSYSNMPKQLKELVSPSDFYNIVQKELERCETEARRPYIPMPVENHESSSSAQASLAQSKKPSLNKAYKCRSEMNAVPTAERRGPSPRRDSKVSDDDDFDNIPISELVAREKNSKKMAPLKKDTKSPAAFLSNSKIYKNTNAKIKETQSLSKSEEVLPQSKQKNSTSHTNCKPLEVRYTASSDELNSSDSLATASDNVSSRSSVSSSTSNKSRKLSENDASTFLEIESIADAEVVSEASQLAHWKLNEHVKSSQSTDTVTSGPASSHSSTLKDASESKSNKSNKSAVSGSPSKKDLPKKGNNSSGKTNAQPQGKGKNANKHNKNRPKSNSSKSSSIPSLSDITTVSSKSLKTYSVMKQIPGSDDSKSKGEK